jgi:hypothetical protein
VFGIDLRGYSDAVGWMGMDTTAAALQNAGNLAPVGERRTFVLAKGDPVDSGLYPRTTRSMVRAVAAALILASSLAGCDVTTSDTTPTDPGVASTGATQPAMRSVAQARELPDGTHVDDLEGWIVLDDGQPKLVDEVLAIFPPAIGESVDLDGVGIDAFDFFSYPQSDLLWADRYLVSGTIRGEVLDVDSLRFLEIEPDRLVAEDCEKALDDTAYQEQCPELWLSNLLEEAER